MGSAKIMRSGTLMFVVRLALLFATLLWAGCASDKPVPDARRAAELSARTAALASRDGYWKRAAAQWADAARRYAAIDDWRESGYALLGEARALESQGDSAQAGQRLVTLRESLLYPTEIQAEAAYQQALLAVRAEQWPLAQAALQAAQAQTSATAALRGAIHNVRARIAAVAQDWATVVQETSTALQVPALEPAERANAQRRQAEARWRLGDTPAALKLLETALALNRDLARATALREDNCLMAAMLKDFPAAPPGEAARYAAVCAQMQWLKTGGP